MTDLIREALTDYYGPQCDYFDPDCQGCQAWRAFDALTAPAPVAVEAGLVERLHPSAEADYIPGEAVRLLRRYGQSTAAEQVNEWIVENNALKSEAASALSSLQEQVEALTRERDAAREQRDEADIAFDHSRRRRHLP